MKQSTLKLTALAMLLGGVMSANAQTADPINVVTTAVPFLRISPDARAGGMGDVGIATSADANSIYWNLSKTVFANSKGGVAVTYTPWLKDLGLNDVYLASAAGYYKIDDQQAISASLRYFSLGNIQFTDNLGNDLSTFRPREFAFDAGYSRKLSSKWALGVALRYINSNLASGTFNGNTYKTGSSVAGDLSVFHNNKLTFGVDIHKLLVPTPPAVGDSAGLANYRKTGVVESWFKSFGDAPGKFSEEIQEMTLSAGAEYWYNNQFALRAGYFYEHPNKGNRKYFTLGAGLKYNMFGLNFSYLLPQGAGVNRNPLSNTLRFSLVFDFDGAAKK